MKWPVARTIGSMLLGAAISLTAASCTKEEAKRQVPVDPAVVVGGQEVKLKGAGSTFAAPVLNLWFGDYHERHQNVAIDYSATGSGDGINQFVANTVDFAASDAAMSDDEIAKVPGGVVMLPVTAGAVVVSYNLPGIYDLKLSRAALAAIFLGKASSWNDPLIASSNPGVNLPNAAISVIHRSDGSGTTFNFTNSLSIFSPEWKAGLGAGKTVAWPVGAGAKQNDGVTKLISDTRDSIGYIEYSYAIKSSLSMAALENKSGKYIKPSPETAANALESVEMPANLRVFAPDPDGDNSYPIVCYTWLLCHTNYDAAKAQVLKGVINYGLSDGQKAAAQLYYVPLPEPVLQKVLGAVDAIK